MTEHELRTHYETVYRMIAHERKMRQQVLAGHPRLQQKLQECDNALVALIALKDELRRQLPPGPIQEVLIDVPTTKKPVGGY